MRVTFFGERITLLENGDLCSVSISDKSLVSGGFHGIGRRNPDHHILVFRQLISTPVLTILKLKSKSVIFVLFIKHEHYYYYINYTITDITITINIVKHYLYYHVIHKLLVVYLTTSKLCFKIFFGGRSSSKDITESQITLHLPEQP